MPILLPVLVRRSVRDTTVPATLPAVAPCFTAAENTAHDWTFSRFEHRRVVVERMAREEEPDRVVFALQPLGRQPRFGRRQRQRLARRTATEQLALSEHRVVVAALRGGHDQVHARVRARAVALQRIERAGGREAFQHALVDGARIDPAREVREVAERPVAARLGDRLDRLRAPRP